MSGESNSSLVVSGGSRITDSASIPTVNTMPSIVSGLSNANWQHGDPHVRTAPVWNTGHTRYQANQSDDLQGGRPIGAGRTGGEATSAGGAHNFEGNSRSVPGSLSEPGSGGGNFTGISATRADAARPQAHWDSQATAAQASVQTSAYTQSVSNSREGPAIQSFSPSVTGGPGISATVSQATQTQGTQTTATVGRSNSGP